MEKNNLKPNSNRVGFHLDSYFNPNEGGCQVYLRVRTNIGKNPYIFLKTEVFVNPKFWDKKSKAVREVKGSPDAIKKNLRLAEMIADLRKMIQTIHSNGGEVNERTLKGGLEDSRHKNLSDFLQWRLSKDTGIRESTRKVEMTRLKKISEFDPEATLESIDSKWVESLVNWLKTEGNSRQLEKGISRGLAPSSVVIILHYLKTNLKWATKNGLIKANPFDGAEFKVKVPSKKPSFLLPQELETMIDAYRQEYFLQQGFRFRGARNAVNGKTYHVALGYFLLSCFTGLRLSDVTRLDDSNIHGDHLVIETQKTGKSMRIKLNELIQELWPVTKTPLGQHNTAPMRIRKVAKELGIEKHLVFHSGRHTFATETLRLTRNLKLTSTMLGHSVISTTEKYAHVYPEQQDAAMELWAESKRDRKLTPSESALETLRTEGLISEGVLLMIEKEIGMAG